MTDFDYAGWVARAQAFVDRIAGLPGVEVRSRDVDPPLTIEQVDRIARAVGRTIPDALRRFLSEGGSRVNCAYGYEPLEAEEEQFRAVFPDQIRVNGGARLCDAAQLPGYAWSSVEWARATWVANDPDQRALWEAGVPFAALDNGDYLALDIRGQSTEAAVVYLCHDDASLLLAPSFAEFLARWEQLCYVGPEHWLLEPFFGPDGTLDARTERAGRLRALFRDRPAPAT